MKNLLITIHYLLFASLLIAQPVIQSGKYRQAPGKDSIAQKYADLLSQENMSKIFKTKN